MTMLRFWKDFIRLQLNNNMRRILKDSIKDFHFVGLNYICFQFDPNLTIRLYVAHPDERVDTEMVSIHNHLYDSQLLLLTGWAENTVYQQGHVGEPHYQYHLTSALHPENSNREIKLKYLQQTRLRKDRSIMLMPGEWHTQLHDEIHSVKNDPNIITSWMVFEFPTVKKHSMLFSPRNLGTTIPTPHCYQRYEEKEVKWLVNDVLSAMP